MSVTQGIRRRSSGALPRVSTPPPVIDEPPKLEVVVEGGAYRGVQISWKEPAASWEPTNFTIAMRPKGGRTKWDRYKWKSLDTSTETLVNAGGRSILAPAKDFLARGLEMGKCYEAAICAKNGAGWGPYSPVSAPLTWPVPPTPRTPLIKLGKVDKHSNSRCLFSVHISWEAPRCKPPVSQYVVQVGETSTLTNETDWYFIKPSTESLVQTSISDSVAVEGVALAEAVHAHDDALIDAARTNVILRGLKEDRTYVATIAAANVFGWSDNSPPSVNFLMEKPPRPRAPRLEVTERSGELRLQWDEAKCFCPVEKYAVVMREFREGKPDRWKFLDAVSGLLIEETSVECQIKASATECFVSGLCSRLQYEARICAKNFTGWGPYSSVSKHIGWSTPSTPMSPRVHRLGAGRLLVTWDAPSSTLPIRHYHLNMRIRGADNWIYIAKEPRGWFCSDPSRLQWWHRGYQGTKVAANGLECAIKGLNEAFEYEAVVTAASDAGSSNPSGPSLPIRPCAYSFRVLLQQISPHSQVAPDITALSQELSRAMSSGIARDVLSAKHSCRADAMFQLRGFVAGLQSDDVGIYYLRAAVELEPSDGICITFRDESIPINDFLDDFSVSASRKVVVILDLHGPAASDLDVQRTVRDAFRHTARPVLCTAAGDIVEACASLPQSLTGCIAKARDHGQRLYCSELFTAVTQDIGRSDAVLSSNSECRRKSKVANPDFVILEKS